MNDTGNMDALVWDYGKKTNNNVLSVQPLFFFFNETAQLETFTGKINAYTKAFTETFVNCFSICPFLFFPFQYPFQESSSVLY